MSMVKILFLSLFVALLSISSAFADIVHLKDGRTLEGEIILETHDAITLKMASGEIVIPRPEIERIEWSDHELAPPEEPRKQEPQKMPEQQPQGEPAKKSPEKPSEEIKIFTVDDWLEFERKFKNYKAIADEEEKLRRIIEWKREYRGRQVILSAKIIKLVEEKKTSLTDEGEKTLTIVTVEAEYLDFRLSTNPAGRTRLWNDASPVLLYTYKVPKVGLGSLKVGDFIFLSAIFPDEEIPRVHLTIGRIENPINVGDKKSPENTTKCLRCGGVGKVPCPATVKCPECNGTGRMKCPTCNGTGLTRPKEGGMPQCCPDCIGPDPQKGGTGRVDCRYCEKTGRIVCPVCEGSRKKECPTCQGAGRTPIQK